MAGTTPANLPTAPVSGYGRRLAGLTRRLPSGAAVGAVLVAQLAVLALVAAIVGVAVHGVLLGHPNGFDDAVARWFSRNRAGWLTSMMRAVTALGSARTLLPLILVVGVVLRRRRGTWAPLALLVTAQAGTILLYEAVKMLVDRPRPSIGLLASAGGYAFPSGHATQSTVVLVAIAVVVTVGTRTRVRVLAVGGAVAVALVVGASRVYLGVHWTTDVIAGWALATAWLVAVAAGAQVLQLRHGSLRIEV